MLADAVYEGTERAIDEAQQVLRDGLRHPEMSRRLAAADTLPHLSRSLSLDRPEVNGKRRPPAQLH